jgi:hypothetical protein
MMQSEEFDGDLPDFRRGEVPVDHETFGPLVLCRPIFKLCILVREVRTGLQKELTGDQTASLWNMVGTTRRSLENWWNRFGSDSAIHEKVQDVLCPFQGFLLRIEAVLHSLKGRGVFASTEVTDCKLELLEKVCAFLAQLRDEQSFFVDADSEASMTDQADFVRPADGNENESN